MTSPLMQAASRIARMLPQGARSFLYRLGPVSRTIQSVLSRAAPDDIATVRIAAGPLEGMQMLLDLRIEKSMWLGTYEPALLDALEHFTRPGDTLYDVGANIGYMTLAMAKAVGQAGHVVAFEPLPGNVVRLQATLGLNEIGDRVRVVAAALGAHTAREPFLVHESGAMGKLKTSKGRNAEYADTLMVEVIALDDWVQNNDAEPPDLIKIDVEGGEAGVLGGMRGILNSHRPVVLIELHGPEAAESAQKALISSEYEIHAMRAGYPILEEIKNWIAHVVAIPREKVA